MTANSGNPDHQLTDATTPDHGTEVPKESLGAVMLLTSVLSVFLLLVAPWVAKPLPEGRMWFLAPVNWPALSLIAMAITSGSLSLPFVRGWLGTSNRSRLWSNAHWAFSGIGVDLIYGVLFCCYLVFLGYAGFTLSTLIFAFVCVWLSGLRGWRWWLTTVLFVAVLVVILRVGLGLWFPQPLLYDFLPKSIGNFASRYF